MAFVLTHLVPGDPAVANLGDRASSDPVAVRLYREHFDLLHGPVGEGVSHWLSLGLIVMICWLGVRRDISARA